MNLSYESADYQIFYSSIHRFGFYLTWTMSILRSSRQGTIAHFADLARTKEIIWLCRSFVVARSIIINCAARYSNALRYNFGLSIKTV